MESLLLAIHATEKPDALLLCFDEGDETFRHEDLEEYKEWSADTPDDFYAQIPRVMELMQAMCFPMVSDARYEADDFLGTYARAGEDTGMQVTIVTGDRDAFQLASDTVRIAIPHKGYQQAEYLGPQEIEEKLGVRPDQVCAYKGLCGDSSDNLPGVLGIGPKTAATLLQDYHTLEGVYENIENIKPKLREKLERDREQAFFCQQMAELVCDIALPLPLDTITFNAIDPQSTLDMFADLHFTLLTKRFFKLLESDYGKEHFITDDIQEEALLSANKESQLSLF